MVTDFQIDFLTNSIFFSNFKRLDPDSTGQGLSFAPYDGHTVAHAQKWLCNYEKNTTKIENLRSKNVFFNFENLFLEHFCKAFNLQQMFDSALLSLLRGQTFGVCFWFEEEGKRSS